jgi:aconitate hydratase
LGDHVKPGETVTLIVHRKNGKVTEVPLTLRLDTPMEIDYVRHGGIMPYVLNELTKVVPARVA